MIIIRLTTIAFTDVAVLPRYLLCAFAVVLGCAPAAQADIVVTVDSMSLAAGTSAFVPVTIYSTAGDLLASTSFDFLLAPSGPAGVQFTDLLDASAQTFTSSNYVFPDSFFQENSIPIGSIIQAHVPNDTFTGGDFAADTDSAGNSLPVPIGTEQSPSLLVDLPVSAAAGLAGTFTISLVAADFSDGTTSYLYTSNAGTVTITGASVVPEPSTWFLGLQAVAALAAVRLRRKRRLPI